MVRLDYFTDGSELLGTSVSYETRLLFLIHNQNLNKINN